MIEQEPKVTKLHQPTLLAVAGFLRNKSLALQLGDLTLEDLLTDIITMDTPLSIAMDALLLLSEKGQSPNDRNRALDALMQIKEITGIR